MIPYFPRKIAVFLGLFLLVQSQPWALDEGEFRPDLSGVTQTLVRLINDQDRIRSSYTDFGSPEYEALVRLSTPAGHRIRLRYTKYGISLVEALKSAHDPLLQKRLIDQVQWAKLNQSRAEAIITLASFHNPAHKRYFKSALLDSQIEIRFAAVEALQIWNQPESITLLQMAMGRDWSPLMEVYAAQALLSLGDKSARAMLLKSLKHKSWVVRAMATRYIGDLGSPNDYKKLIRLLSREKNNFVTAELSVSALKLISMKADKVSYSPARPGWKENEEVGYTLGKHGIVELDPLIIIPPRLRIPASLRIAARINSELLNLMKDKLDEPLDSIDEQDPLREELFRMSTPSGFALKTRYAELSYLVTEGLAGTSDPFLKQEIRSLAEETRSELIRASAMISLAYSRDEYDTDLILDALGHKSATVRFGALEAIDVGHFRTLLPAVNTSATSDPIPAIRAYAAQIMAKFGDPAGRLLLLAMINDEDWVARSMAYWYLSRYGDDRDYATVLSRLSVEDDPFVLTEIALAALRLAPIE